MAVFEFDEFDNSNESPDRQPVTVSDAKPAAEQCYPRISIPVEVAQEAGVSAGDQVVWDIDDWGRLTCEVL